ncbi:hypothetical protein BRCON_0957 [Candidatus Sumerlaea chitinivorans]|uniref:Outer membrane lipoprotein carrier protein LolA n=1 Tax=Sumerlaea chitinivorans TaxID=2250252 RepID=A0A2Z4Y3N8_SUMC1|nr:hypothetical protein BRCON_0957 [Candidatus Sumerlaea chitinivorans]
MISSHLFLTPHVTAPLSRGRSFVCGTLLSVILCSAHPVWSQTSRSLSSLTFYTPTTHSLLLPPAGESLADVREQIESKLAALSAIRCDVEMSKAREKKITRKVYTGPLEILRGHGGRVSLTRKGQTEIYIANPKVLWSYEPRKKEAQFIPANTPVIGQFVEEALRFNAFLAMDENTMKLLGSQTCDSEPCWVIEGKSPRKLVAVGVPVTKMRVWVSKNDGLPRKIHLPTEKDLTIVLRNFQLNPPDVTPSAFEWSPPKGVRTKNIFGF